MINANVASNAFTGTVSPGLNLPITDLRALSGLPMGNQNLGHNMQGFRVNQTKGNK